MILSRFEKEVLMAHALQVSRSRLLSHPELFNENDPKYLRLADRRLNHEPLAYIIGGQPFLGLEIFVDRRVLIPRPETEEMAEMAIKIMKNTAKPNEKRTVIDVGTGSGAIAVCLAKNLPDLKIIGIDSSAEALAVARKNAKRHGVSNRCRFVEGDMLDNAREKADLIISNPPYIPAGDIDGLSPEIRDWEPRSALDGGGDGLKYIRKIIKSAPDYLKKGGRLMLEFGYGQSEMIKKEAEKFFPKVNILKDLSGIKRFLLICT